MNNFPSDQGIPMLTEVIPVQRPEPAPFVAPAPADDPLPVAGSHDLPAGKPAAMDDRQWQQLETDLREVVLEQLLGRVETMLEQRVRDTLADVLQIAVSNLADEIRGGLRDALTDMVEQAIADELAQVRVLKK